MKTTAEILAVAADHLRTLRGHTFDVLELSKPVSVVAATNMMKIISKLSPLLGNLIEINMAEMLNTKPEFEALGHWERQDPGFPDVVFRGVEPLPGFEVKAWFPFATEITSRFKDSQKTLAPENTQVASVAWLPEHIVYGRPYILDVCIVSGLSVAQARDAHYHNPPDYLVLEPEDTTLRTRNLQQSTTSGYKFQGSDEELEAAKIVVEGWGPTGNIYQPSPDYQAQLRELTNRYRYRLDTNFAKMDRVVHPELEAFKQNVMGMTVKGLTVGQWGKLLGKRKEAALRAALETRIGIREAPPDELLQ